MKKIIILLVALFYSTSLFSQTENGYIKKIYQDDTLKIYLIHNYKYGIEYNFISKKHGGNIEYRDNNRMHSVDFLLKKYKELLKYEMKLNKEKALFYMKHAKKDALSNALNNSI